MSKRIRYVLMGVGLIAVAALCWFFLLSPLRGEIAETERQIDDESQKLSLAKTTLAQAEATREEGRRNQARLLELNKMVPPSPELPSLLLQLQDLADQSGIDFIAVTPSAPREAGKGAAYQILPLEVEFMGLYFDISDFIWRVEQMVAGPGRLLAVKAVTLSPETESAGGEAVSPPLSASMTLYAFVLAEAAPPPAAAPPTPEESTEVQ